MFYRTANSVLIRLLFHHKNGKNASEWRIRWSRAPVVWASNPHVIVSRGQAVNQNVSVPLRVLASHQRAVKPSEQVISCAKAVLYDSIILSNNRAQLGVQKGTKTLMFDAQPLSPVLIFWRGTLDYIEIRSCLRSASHRTLYIIHSTQYINDLPIGPCRSYNSVRNNLRLSVIPAESPRATPDFSDAVSSVPLLHP
jgi:hypothetical protein